MGKIYEELTPQLIEFISAQHMFFVGTAPLAGEGHVNISPKGKDAFRVIDNNTVAYMDKTGSGVETLAHVKENGRLVIMFCAFEGRPLTLRLHGHAEALEIGHPEFAGLQALFPDLPALRSIIRLRLTRIADSCGWTVPLYDYAGPRDVYDKTVEKRGRETMRALQLEKNMQSIDGLPGLNKPTL